MKEKTLFNSNWKFYKTSLDTTLEEVKEEYNSFIPVDLPHDWLIYNTKDLYENSQGWYRKEIFVINDKQETEDMIKSNHMMEALFVDQLSGERVQIRFDGIYMDCSIYVNEKWIGDWKYGYSTFDFDITDDVKVGVNSILVQVRHQSPNSRWYSGAGIYRNVWIRVCSSVYMPWDGTYISTKSNGDDYIMEIETEIEGDISSAVQCRYSLWFENTCVQDLGTQRSFKKTEKYLAETIVKIQKPKLWDIVSPNCYQVLVELYDERQKQIDKQWITIGFRSILFHPDKGLLLNGHNVKVHGVCEHHDFGCLGAVFYKAAMRRKMVLLREMGVNAIRTGHNMPAPELMDLADEMGFLVMSEAFDMWEKKKTEYDYARFFREWAEKDIASWVRRDRNHPSLFLWSIGNEIYDTHVDEHGQEITHRLIHYVREHDPKENARITIGSNYMPWENAKKCADIVKIAGYNYGERYYNEHHNEHPDWIIYGSETGSIVQSRGVYHFPLSQSTLADEDQQCSALGNSTTSWGAKSVEKCITDDRDATFSFGQFLWTGFDYIGEPTPYHTKNSYYGHLDTAGFPKDSYYIFQGEWRSVKEYPMVHLFPYWDFNVGQMIDVRAGTNGASVELLVNGTSMGRQKIDHRQGKKLLGEWRVPYEPGEIKAVAYDEEGNIIGEESKFSFGDGVKIILETNQPSLKADGEDLCFLTIMVVDSKGRLVENAMNYVEVSVHGEGRLLGLDNGDSTDYDEYKCNCRKLFNGKLLAVIASTTSAGTININVTGEGLISAEMTLHSKKAEIREGISILEHIGVNQDSKYNHESKCNQDSKYNQNKRNIPVRKVELKVIEGQKISQEKKEVLVNAKIYPPNATDQELIWKAVNAAGIEIGYAFVEEIEVVDQIHIAKVTAIGDGEFWIRCMSRSGGDTIKIISQMEFHGSGLGKAFLNPYEGISAGFYCETIGEIGNGNEKGIATARDGVSGVVYSNMDFGDYGSDEITMEIFALSNAAYPIEIWIGNPKEEGSELLSEVIYQKPSIWNVYQKETWKLPRRIKGVTSIAFVLKSKIHVKEFSFTKYNKGSSKLFAAECNQIYGDNFDLDTEIVHHIGNNVTLVFDNMDFTTIGVNRISICGRTRNPMDTIHIHFTTEQGETYHRIVEYNQEREYEEKIFTMETLYGRGRVEFIFLPGSDFDFHYFQFHRIEEDEEIV